MGTILAKLVKKSDKIYDDRNLRFLIIFVLKFNIGKKWVMENPL